MFDKNGSFWYNRVKNKFEVKNMIEENDALGAISEQIVSGGSLKGISYEDIPIHFGSLIPISESTFKSLFDRHNKTGWVIVSANRSEDEERTRDINVSQYMKLRKELDESPFSYVPTWGGFLEHGRDTVNPEPSFIVYPDKTGKDGGDNNNFKDLLGFALGACKRYGQDSIMVKYPEHYPDDPDREDKTFWLRADGTIDSRFNNDPIWDDPSQMYYTKDRRRAKGGADSFKRWSKGGDPTTYAEEGDVPKHYWRKGAKPPSRFSSEFYSGPDAANESWIQFVEPPPSTISGYRAITENTKLDLNNLIDNIEAYHYVRRRS